MAEQTGIEWADSTFNPWMGCSKISPACDHCYAERDTKRFGSVSWGPGAQRVRTSAAYWRKPLQWHAKPFAQCADCGWRGQWPDSDAGRRGACPACDEGALVEARRRVFCASLADVFDNEVDAAWLADLLDLIRRTENLDWLLLTKRIGNWRARLTAAHQHVVEMMGGGTEEHRGHVLWPLGMWIQAWLAGSAPVNVWMMSTICNQQEADRDVPKLLAVPARVRGLSIEPMLGPVNVQKWLDPWSCADCGYHGSENDCGPDGCQECGAWEAFEGSDACHECGADDQSAQPSCPSCGSHRSYARDHGFLFVNPPDAVGWVIVGGESGPHARPFHPEWVRSLRDQCAEAAVPFLFKQWGEWRPINEGAEDWYRDLYVSNRRAREGELQERLDEIYGTRCTVGRCAIHIDGSAHDVLDPKAWAQDARPMMTFRVGKKSAGRMLDGREHSAWPDDAGDHSARRGERTAVVST